MRNLPILVLLFFPFYSFPQNPYPDNFKIGNYLEVFKKDSLKIYFNCTGSIVEKKCASYYRIGKMDSSVINVNGQFEDYYISGNLFLKATMLNNFLEGHATYFYPNGNVKEEGHTTTVSEMVFGNIISPMGKLKKYSIM